MEFVQKGITRTVRKRLYVYAVKVVCAPHFLPFGFARYWALAQPRRDPTHPHSPFSPALYQEIGWERGRRMVALRGFGGRPALYSLGREGGRERGSTPMDHQGHSLAYKIIVQSFFDSFTTAFSSLALDGYLWKGTPN